MTNLRGLGFRIAAASVMFLLTGAASFASAGESSSETRPSKDAMRGKIQKKRQERKRSGGEKSDSGRGASESAPQAEKSVGDEVSDGTPMTRTFLLATLATELRPEHSDGESAAAAESLSADDGDRSLLDAVLGFESEIEPNDPETRAGIDRARVKSGLAPSTRSPEAESIEWESAPTSIE